MKLKITITTAIFSIIVLAIGVMGVLAAISLYSHQVRDQMQADVKKIDALHSSITKLELDFLTARRFEKDYLLRGSKLDIDQHAYTMQDLETAFEEIKTQLIDLPDMQETVLIVPKLATAIFEYNSAFRNLVAQKTKIGMNERSGIRKQLNTAVKTLEKQLKELPIPIMHAKVLNMRMHEKDFMLAPNRKYLDEFNKRVEEFRGFPVFFFDNAEQKASLDPVLDAYQAAFTAYVEGSLEGLNIRKTVSEQYATAEPVMMKLSTAVSEALEKTLLESEHVSAQATTLTIRAGLGGAGLFVFVVFFLARGISRPLKQTDQVLKKMMNSDFSPKIPTSGIREISAIATAVGDFRKAEESKHNITQQMSHVIEACANGDFSNRMQIDADGGLFAELGQGINAIGDVAEKGLTDVQEALKILATGDLTHQMPTGQKGVFKDISDAIDHLGTSLDGMVRQLSSSSEVLANTSQEISSAVDDASRRGELSAASLEETSSALQTVSDTVRDTAQSAQDARQVVNEAQDKAEAARDVADQTVSAMQRIKDSSEAISQITDLIEDVAFQTNLLALNAGVEAARAGDAGRGFAVVASEVRGLAQRSSDAAQEINTLISSSKTEVATGVDLMDQTGTSLEEILQMVGQVVVKVNEIAENTVDQSHGLAEVNAAVESLDKGSQKSAAMLEETSAAGQVLRGEAQNLVQAVSGFTLKEASISDVSEDDLDEQWDAA